jgi:hypothetical protein
MELGRGSCVADRIYRNLKGRLDARRALPKPTYSLADRLKQENGEEEKSNGAVDDGYNSDRENNEEVSFNSIFRSSHIF